MDNITIIGEPDDTLAARLEAEIAATGIRDARDFSAAPHDDRGELMAGATCRVERLWVREDARDRGLGSRLLAAVESEARARPRPARADDPARIRGARRGARLSSGPCEPLLRQRLR